MYQIKQHFRVLGGTAFASSLQVKGAASLKLIWDESLLKTYVVGIKKGQCNVMYLEKNTNKRTNKKKNLKNTKNGIFSSKNTFTKDHAHASTQKRIYLCA